MFVHFIKRNLIAILISTFSIAGSSAFAQSSNNSWAGPYAGLQFGYASGDVDWALNGNGWWGVANTANNQTSFSPKGMVAGVHAGYAWQSQNNIYWGIEAALNFPDLNESKASPAFPGIDTWTVDIENYWDVSGRIGYAQNKYLLFVSAGIAGAKVESVATPPIDRSDDRHIGFSLGVGGEYKIADNASIGLEYKYYDFGNQNHSFNPACGPCAPGDGRSIDVNLHVVNLRLSYQF